MLCCILRRRLRLLLLGRQRRLVHTTLLLVGSGGGGGGGAFPCGPRRHCGLLLLLLLLLLIPHSLCRPRMTEAAEHFRWQAGTRWQGGRGGGRAAAGCVGQGLRQRRRQHALPCPRLVHAANLDERAHLGSSNWVAPLPGSGRPGPWKSAYYVLLCPLCSMSAPGRAAASEFSSKTVAQQAALLFAAGCC